MATDLDDLPIAELSGWSLRESCRRWSWWTR